MRYVTGKPWRGQVGHQLSVMWYAKLFSELFDFTYVHSPFIDRPKYQFSCAAAWNGFFNIGFGECQTESVSKRSGRITHSFGEYLANMNIHMRYHQLAKLADAVPDQYVLSFDDLCPISPSAILAWEQQGFARQGTLQRMCEWFQGKLDRSLEYQATEAYQHPEGMVRVAIYWRNFFEREVTSVAPVRLEQLEEAMALIRAAVFPKPVSVVVFTQYLPDKLPAIVADHLEFIPAKEPDPIVRTAYRSLIEADVALTTLGNSSTIVGIYRAFKRPTIGMDGWTLDGYRIPGDGSPIKLPEGLLANVV